MAETDEDSLLRNVADLRRKLILTEQNLQLFKTPSKERKYRHDLDEDTLLFDAEERVPPLTLDDLTPDQLTSVSSVRSQDSNYSRTAGKRRSRASTASQASSRGQSHREKYVVEEVTSLHRSSSLSLPMSSPSMEEANENRRLRKKLKVLRDENAELVAENHSLHNKIESSQYELRLTKGQTKMLSLEMDSSRSKISTLKEKCDSLKSELKANDAALRMAEKNLGESGRQMSEKDSLVQRHRQDTKKLMAELLEEQKLRHRMETQRDEIAHKLDELSAQLESYRSQTQDQLQKLAATEEHLRGSLEHCDLERDELLARATTLEEDLQDARDEIRSLRESNSRLAQSESALRLSQNQTQEQTDAIQDLQAQLQARERENGELVELTERQGERLRECQGEIESSRSELQRLEALVARKTGGREGSSTGQTSLRLRSGDLSGDQLSTFGADSGIDTELSQEQILISHLRYQLTVKEAELQQLRSLSLQAPATIHASAAGLAHGSSSPNSLRAQLATLMEKSKLGEKKALELEKVIGQLESEAAQRTNESKRLKLKLAQSEEERTSVESRMSLRDKQLTQLHSDLQEKDRQIMDLGKQLKKVRGQMSALDSQLEEKTAAFSAHVSKMEQLQGQLDSARSRLAATKGELAEKTSSEELQTSKMEEVKKLTKEQCQELHQQLQQMQERVEAQSEELRTLHTDKAELQRGAVQKEEHLARLQSDLAASQKELVKKNVENQQLWNSLQTRADEGALRLAQMEAALVVCKQELETYLTQLEDGEKRHKQALGAKDKEIAELEERWRKARVEGEERGLRAAESEQTLRERQQMLQQSTDRISELEDREGQLDQQVATLAKELTQLRAAASQEMGAMETKLHQACADLEERSQLLRDTTEELSSLKADLLQAQSKAQDLDQKLTDAHRDAESMEDKTTQLEKELHASQTQLDNAHSSVKELEEVLRRTKEETLQAKEHCRHQDQELQQAQEELKAAASQLGELHRLLQRSKAENKLKQEQVQELSQSLRESQNEMKSKDRDIDEIDLALKTSQRTLLQRSAQVSQLDVAVKERQSEMERQILELETSLNTAQYQLKQSKHKLSEMEETGEKQRQENHAKTLRIQDLEGAIQRQGKEASFKDTKLTRLQERVDELSSQIKENKEEYLAQSQELRLSREQTQQAHINLTDIQRQLAQVQRQQDNISSELEDAHETILRKDQELARLAQEVGASRAQELALQAQYAQELQQIARLREQEVEQKEAEVTQLQESHAHLLATSSQQDSAHRQELAHLKQARQERAAELEAELAAAREVINASNEAMVIKESEIARLKAKLSGYERIMSGTSLASHGGSVSSHQQASPISSSPPPIESPYASPRAPLSLHQGGGHVPTYHHNHNHSQSASAPMTSGYGHSGEGSGGQHGARLSWENPSLDLSTETTMGRQDLPRTYPAEKPESWDHIEPWSPGIKDSMKRLDQLSPPSDMTSGNGLYVHDTKLSGDYHKDGRQVTSTALQTQDQLKDRLDALSDITETNSALSGIERLPEEPQTFQAMLEFVNKQLYVEESSKIFPAAGRDEDWLNPDNMSDGSFLVTPTGSSRTSTEPVTSLSPPTPLKSIQNSPASPSPKAQPPSPRRRSGIPLRKREGSPGRRKLHFSKGGGSSHGSTGTAAGKKKPSGGRKVEQMGSRGSTASKEKLSSPEATPLKQKLANQKAKLASHAKAQPIKSSQFKPKECIADLQAKLQANDARRQQINKELFSV